MASRYHRMDPPKKPGLRHREQQMAQALSMQADASVIGSGTAQRLVDRAKSALTRQQRLRATGGKSAY